MKIQQTNETEFTNKEWGMRVAVVGAPNRPGYLTVVSPYDPKSNRANTFIRRDPIYYDTLRKAVAAALDIIGAE